LLPFLIEVSLSTTTPVPCISFIRLSFNCCSLVFNVYLLYLMCFCRVERSAQPRVLIPRILISRSYIIIIMWALPY
jgi:hypothetical protein